MPQSKKPRDNMPAPTNGIFFRTRIKANAGEHAAQADQDENRQLDLQSVGKHFRTDERPNQQEQHEQSQQVCRTGRLRKRALPHKRNTAEMATQHCLEHEDNILLETGMPCRFSPSVSHRA